MHPDGSYSAFGEADREGSTWLTAFVFKTLRQAMQFIYIDRKQIQTKSWEFLLHQQGVDGCFDGNSVVELSLKSLSTLYQTAVASATILGISVMSSKGVLLASYCLH